MVSKQNGSVWGCKATPCAPCSHVCHETISLHCSVGAATAGGVVASPTEALTFLRGMVMTDNSGLATVETIYPGRYTGRTPHIHVKVTPMQALARHLLLSDCMSANQMASCLCGPQGRSHEDLVCAALNMQSRKPHIHVKVATRKSKQRVFLTSLTAV